MPPASLRLNEPFDTTTAPTELEVSLADVWPVFAISSSAGIALAPIIEKLGLPANLLDKPEGKLSLTNYFLMLCELSLICHDETCRLSERPLMLGTSHFVLKNLANCATLREAMQTLADSYNMLNGGPYNQVRESEDQLLFVIDDSNYPYSVENEAFIQSALECVLIQMHGLLNNTGPLDQPLPASRVYLKRRAETADSHLRFWNAPIRYQSPHYAIAYDLELADRPICVPEGGFTVPRLFSQLIEMIELQQLNSGRKSLKEMVRIALLDGLKDQQLVARDLGLSVATMRRRLKQEDCSFRDIRQAVLQELATTFLNAGFHSNDVAEKLGFSDLRSFSRAFKGWYSMTPSEYRQR